MGDLPIIELLIEKRPELLKIEDSKGIIPEQLAREIANNPLAYDVLKNFLLSEGRSIARHETYKKILEVFFNGRFSYKFRFELKFISGYKYF